MPFDDLAVARVFHVASIVGWIGGVWFVTFVVMPAITQTEPPEQRMAAFHRIEQGFAPQARFWVLLAGASGLWMAWRADMWSRFAEAAFWWMHAMLGLWLAFFLMLFVAEPLFLHQRLARSATPAADFARLVWLHRLLSIAALVTTLRAMAGAHGLI